MNPIIDDLSPQPLSHALALHSRYYTDPAMVDIDRTRVFARSWQLVGHARQIANAGDHLVTDIAGLPLVVIRDTEGSIRAFHNVCRHRAGPLALCDGKGAKTLQCKYHGWTYTLDGVLRSAPEMKNTADFEVSDIRLPELRVATWHGLMFVGGEGAPDFADFSRGFDEALRGHSPDDYVFHRRHHYDIDCNWKVYCDNYLEGYHVPFIHPGLNKLLDYRNYHSECADWFSSQHSPLDSDDALYGCGEAVYYFIYPNTTLNLLPGRLQTNRVLPLGHDRCRVVFDYYYIDDSSPEAEARREADHRFAHEVQDEDISICEHVQRGLESGSYAAGRLNPLRENALHHFHELLRRAYRQPSATP